MHVGSSASVALLQFMKDVVNRNVGETDFSRFAGDSEAVMEESEPTVSANNLYLDTSRISEYVENYLACVGCRIQEYELS